MQFESARDFILTKLASELSPLLSYHNLAHTLDVADITGQLAAAESINGRRRMLLLTAAYFHDSGYLTAAKNHEEGSCRFARLYLPGYAYTPEDIKQVCSIIMATKIPQAPADVLGQILADADLDYLGRSDFAVLSNALYNELVATAAIARDDRNWDMQQVAFMEQHQYFTASSGNLRKHGKEGNLSHVKTKLKRTFG